MPVFRVQKNENYTTMCNYHLRDKSLSLKAKGLLSMFLSLPDSWHYSVRGLVAISKENRSSIMSGLKELEAAGYLVRNQRRDSSGRMADIEYIISELPTVSPWSENPTTDNPTSEKPTAEKPITENLPGISTKLLSKEGINTERRKYRGDKASAHVYGKYKNVVLSADEYSALQQDFPNDFAFKIERLSEYMASTGKTYENHLATIRSWARKDGGGRNSYSYLPGESL